MFDYEKRAFKLDELQSELRHEDYAEGNYNPYNKPFPKYVPVYVDGKFWKGMPLEQARKAIRTLARKGKHAEIRR